MVTYRKNSPPIHLKSYMACFYLWEVAQINDLLIDLYASGRQFERSFRPVLSDLIFEFDGQDKVPHIQIDGDHAGFSA